MTRDGLRRRAGADYWRLGRRYGLSIFAASMPIEQLVRVAPIPHRRLHKTTVGRLRRAGFDIEATGARPHCTVWLGMVLTDEVLDRFIGAFDPAEDNPVP